MTDDLRDALSAAYDKVEETPDAPEADAVERVEPEADQGTESAETARARDEQGRFTAAEKAAQADGKDKPRETLSLKEKPNAAKEQERAQEQPKAAAEQGTAQPQQPAAPGQTAQGAEKAGAQTVPPPAHWLGAAKKHWDRLPSEVREHIAQDGRTANEAQAIRQAVAPVQQVLEREFGGVDRGLTSILSTWQYARAHSLDFIQQFAQHHNIDLRKLAGEAPQAQQGNPVEADPVLAPVLQRVQQLEAALQQVSQQPLIAQQNQIQTEVEAFGNAIAADGKVAHPYFNDVKPVMAALMSSGQAKTLPDAYDMAVYANPQIRASMIAAEQAKQNDARRRAAESARNAAAPVTGAPGHRGPGMPQNETVGDTLLRNFDKAVSGARA